MSRFNGKLFVILVLSAVLLGGGVYFFHEYQSERSAAKLLEQARRFEKQGKVDRSLAYMDRYLTFKPNDNAALIEFGSLIQKSNDSQPGRLAALDAFEKVLRNGRLTEDVENDVHRHMAHICFDLDRFVDARMHARTVLTYHPSESDMERVLGRCDQAEGLFKEAATWYEHAISHDPKTKETYLHLAFLLRRKLDKPKQADEVVERLIAANSQSFEAYLERSIYRKLFGLPGAEEDSALAVKLAPKNPATLFLAANFAREKRDWEHARGYLIEGIKQSPYDRRFYQSLADVERQQNRLKDAEKYLAQGVAELPNDDQLKWEAAALQVQRGDFAKARTALSNLRNRGYRPELLDYLESHMLVAEKQWLKAAKNLERIRPLLSSDTETTFIKSVDTMLVQCYEKLGQTDQLYAAYRRMVADNPSADTASLGFAESLESMGNFDRALAQYQQLAPKRPEAKIEIARLLILKNLGLPTAQRRWNEVAQALDAASQAVPDSPRVPILRAEALVAQDRFDAAQALLERARDARPDQITIWLALVSILERRGTLDAIPPILDAAVQKLGDSIELRLAQARYLSIRGESKASAQLAKLAERIDKFSADDQGRLFRGLAQAYYRVGDNPGALKLWNQWAKQAPDDLNNRSVTFELALKANDDAAMVAAMEAIQRIEQREEIYSTLGRHCQATYLIWKAGRGDKSGLTEARNLLREVAARRPEWSRVPLAEAKINELNGDQDGTVREYVRAIDLGERDPEVIRRTLELLFKRNRYADANRIMAKLQDQTVVFSQLQRYAAEMSLQNRDFDHAVELAQKAVSSNSTDYHDYIWLGQILGVVGRRAEAETSLRRAVELAANEPEPRVALVQFLTATDQKDKAATETREAESRLDRKKHSLALALCHELVGQHDQARELYLAAATSKPNDSLTLRDVASYLVRRGQIREAQPFLQRIIDLPEKSNDDLNWANQTLAVLLAAEGDPQKRAKALEMIGAVSKDSAGAKADVTGDASDRLRTRAQVLAGQKDPALQREAISILEGLVTRDQMPNDRFLLAQLYEAEGQWPKAEESMLASLRTNKRPVYVAEYIRALIRHNQADKAAPWIAELEKQEPNTQRTVKLKALVLKALGKANDAIALLKEVADRDPVQTQPVAALLDEIGEDKAAEDLLRKYASLSKGPEAALALAEFLGRHGRVAEGLDICEKLWKANPSPNVAMASINIVATGEPDAAQIKRVENWIEAARTRDPNNKIFALSLAKIRYLEKRYRDSETIYRSVLQQDKNDLTALNNIAWMLAHEPGHEKEGLELINRAIDYSGPNPSLLDTRAVIYLAMNQGDQAIADLEASIVTDTNDPSKFFHLAQGHWMVKNRDAAIEAIRKGQAQGLKLTVIDPLERAIYEQVMADLGQK